MFLMLLSVSFSVPAQAQFALHDGDRVAFYGDEITAVQFYDNALEPRIYPTFIETYVATRFPKTHIDFVDSAWSGDRVSGGAGGSIQVRLQRDVIRYKPTVLTIMLGMNDARTVVFNPKDHESYTTGYDISIDPATAVFDTQRFAAYTSGYERLLDMVKQALPGLRITLLKPPPCVDVSNPPHAGAFNRVLLQYGEALETLDKGKHATFVDPNVVLISVLRSAYREDAAVARDIIPDGIHPAAAGHLVIAEAVLKAWGAPSLVSDVEIDARARRVKRAENSSVHDLSGSVALSWMQTDEALPFPLDMSDPAVSLISRTSDFAHALDQEELKVEGLSASRYKLRIDDDVVGTFDAAQLEAGVNLALLDTPMKKQALRVFHIVQERENVHFGVWKRLEFPVQDLSLAHKQQAAQAMAALEQDLREEQHAAAQPLPHRYELQPVEANNATLRVP